MGTAYSQHSSPVSLSAVLAGRLSLTDVGYSCPNFFSSSGLPCEETWVHYIFSPDNASPDGQTIYDLSGNGLHATNGLTAAVEPSDASMYVGITYLGWTGECFLMEALPFRCPQSLTLTTHTLLRFISHIQEVEWRQSTRRVDSSSR